jgi:threonyl-tRNA synthetase
MKMGELGTVYRYEKSGELHGLQRVRGFTQNDAHIFCTADQLKEEFLEVMEMLEKFYNDLGFDNYKYRLSLRDNEKNKYVGDKKAWEQAQNAMREVLQESGVEFYEEKGEAAFYGPKVDVQAVNVFGKEDSISTIQVDFNLPERFDINYIDETGKDARPFVIHRALIGSFERFFAFLIEHYAGNFPLWLAPVQVAILPVSEKFDAYAQDLFKQLKAEDLRAELHNQDESLGKRIALAKQQKIPYLLVVGEKEVAEKTVSINQRGVKKQEALKFSKFLGRIKQEIIDKTIF